MCFVYIAMPSGNGAKAAQKRERNLKKKGDAKGSQLDARAAAFKMVCNICRAPLTNASVMKQHYESKHPNINVPVRTCQW